MRERQRRRYGMIKVIDHNTMGKSERGWLHSLFHFSFAEYYNPDNIRFGALRVVNDDTFDPQGGFPTHPHNDMEIISYVVEGELTHQDSLGNGRTLTKGQVQYMSAGKGILHSEFNRTDKLLRFLQIWILPDAQNYEPNYGDYDFVWEDRESAWLQIASGKDGSAPVKINQDMNVSVVNLKAGSEISYELQEGRQAYLIQIEGTGSLNGNMLTERDAAEIVDERTLSLSADTESHYILFDMKRD